MEVEAVNLPNPVRHKILRVVKEGDKAIVSKGPSGRWRVGRESARRKMSKVAREVKPWRFIQRRRTSAARLSFEPADLGTHSKVGRNDIYEGRGTERS